MNNPRPNCFGVANRPIDDTLSEFICRTRNAVPGDIIGLDDDAIEIYLCCK